MHSPRISEAELTQDVDSVFNDITIFEREDMTISSRKKIAQRYNRTPSNPSGVLWVVKEFCYNSNNEVVMVQILSMGKNIPEWCAIYPEVDR